MKPNALRRGLCRHALASLIALLPATLLAQTAARFPDKPLRIIVAGTAGGSSDIMARLLADQLGKDSGQPVIVEPKPGAGGSLAVAELGQAAHDGYTVMVGVNSLVSEIPQIMKLKIDMPHEIMPVAELARGGLVLVGTPTLPASTLKELVGYVKANPGKVNVASYSAGTISHVIGVQLNKAAGIDMVHVGYKGSTPALTDVMGGHVPLMFDAMPTSLPLIKAGKLKAYAVSTPKRFALLPEVPTFAEQGYPQLEAVAWLGLWVKPDVPAAMQAKLREAALKALAGPAVKGRLAEIGFEPGQPRSPQELAAALKADSDKMAALLKAIDFKPE
ncbi:Bug family tripartite tricarboxylate transporter substrate binding protein [Aquabacterium sp.]|uniref:Bug family tripartite tricarboxylate transporter substrate binding protein n=1 Tax=Aquabacterium sp. TaxID=1872578 RepID=UPI003785177F